MAAMDHPKEIISAATKTFQGSFDALFKILVTEQPRPIISAVTGQKFQFLNCTSRLLSTGASSCLVFSADPKSGTTLFIELNLTVLVLCVIQSTTSS